MSIAALTAIVAVVTAPLPVAPQERPVTASTTYRVCASTAMTQAEERVCLASEVEWERRALAAAVAGTGVDAESQALWERSMRHDCQGEYELAGGGNSADMRQMACEIEQTADRTDYLLRRGKW